MRAALLLRQGRGESLQAALRSYTMYTASLQCTLLMSLPNPRVQCAADMAWSGVCWKCRKPFLHGPPAQLLRVMNKASKVAGRAAICLYTRQKVLHHG